MGVRSVIADRVGRVGLVRFFFQSSPYNARISGLPIFLTVRSAYQQSQSNFKESFHDIFARNSAVPQKGGTNLT